MLQFISHVLRLGVNQRLIVFDQYSVSGGGLANTFELSGSLSSTLPFNFFELQS